MHTNLSNVIYLVFFGLFQIDYTVQHTPIQLRGGKNRQQGRVEVYHSGQWGTICDDKFDQNDARVVCRMIGLEVLHPIFGRGTPGTGRIWMDDLECNGEETDLTGCLFSGWSNNNCQHEEDISVNCDVTEVRLTNGTFAGEGRIEIKHDGEWGSICGNSFSVTAATVICQMLGFNNTTPTIHGHGYFGKAHGKVLMDQLVCSGNETDINQCTFPGWEKTNCRHDEDVGISCATPVRLVGGPIPSKGRLEVYHAGNWGTVCSDGFDTKDAIVVCRTLGFLTSHPVVYSTVNFGVSSLSIAMDDLACDGTEHDISACKFRGWGSNNCNHRKDVVVQCQTRVRLVDGPTPSRGRVEVMYRGEWGTICDDSFRQEEAAVVCRMLGYHNSNYRLYGSSHYNEGLGKIWMDDLSCDGSESDIINCKYPGWGQTNCAHSEDVSLDCDARVYLSNGQNAGQGTVNVYHESQWGSVCDDKFDVDDAKVICGMVGHHTLSPTVYSQAHFGQRSGPIWLDAVQCSGKESDLGSCPHKGWGKHDCSHSEDAGVDCGTAFRLINGNHEFEGRVEVFHGGIWGTICDNSFNVEEARVVCKILGYNRQNPVVYGNAHFGEGSGKIWIDSVSCGGSETSFDSCVGRYSTYYRTRYTTAGWWGRRYSHYRHHSTSHSAWGHHSCAHSEDVSIACKTPVRLVNGSSETEGRVEVYYNNQWGTICDNAFDANDAKVICRMLGYDTTFAEAFGDATYGKGVGSILMNNLGCSGSEIDIGDCHFDGWTSSHCNHSSDVGVSCGAKIRLTNGTNVAQGRVEIHHNGNWGTICDNSFNITEGEVICRMLGFDDSNVKIFPGAHFGQGNTSILMERTNCVGTETDLSYCSFSGWGRTSCTHGHDVSVGCSLPLRLAGGSTFSEGRVEVRLGEHWGTVCIDNLGVKEARVICKSLGYDIRQPQITTMFGHGEGVNTITNLRCNGSESSIRECVFEWVGKTTCTQGHYAGVICTSDIRLTNGKSPTEGRIEIKHNNIYSSVCASNFDDVDASVVCSMLGFNNPYPDLCDSCFGTTPGFHLTNVNCTGDELDVETCPSSGWQSGNCSNGGDVGLICKTRVRLNGGDNPSEGRLEVYHHQKWGTVCSDGFEQLDGRVICTMLGYNTTNPHVSAIPITTDVPEVWMTQINCFGTEDDITACSFPGWSLGNCSTSNYVNIECGIGVRLVDGLKPYEGRVEVSHEGQWGTICNNGFTVNDARVICRMLGFETENVTVYVNATFGNGSSNIMMDNLKCIGNETHIAACSFTGWGKHKCQHNQDVSISCGQTPLRLVNGTRHSVGRLEVYHNNKWGSVCDNNFDINDAKVVCRSLELNTKVPYVLPSAYFGRSSGMVLLENVDCNGTEKDIALCPSNGWGHSDCSHDQDVSVLCDTMVKLVGGTDQSNGRVEIFNDGKWGTICDDGFNVPDAAVICNMLGFNNSYQGCKAYDLSNVQFVYIRLVSDAQIKLVRNPNSYEVEEHWGPKFPNVVPNEVKVIYAWDKNPKLIHASHFGYGSGEILLRYVECRGNEHDISDCNHPGWRNIGDCLHSEDVGVDCSTGIRLVGGQGPFEGLVEVFHDGEWGTICNHGFDVNDAKVICNTLGYQESTPSVVPVSKYRSGFGPIWLENVMCTGNEVDIALCNSNGWGNVGQCSHTEDAALTCGENVKIQIIGGKGHFEGSLELTNDTEWFPICADGFSMDVAKVVCQHFKYPASENDPTIIDSSEFGNHNISKYPYKVHCTGGEFDVALCNITLLRSCPNNDYVGVRCPRTQLQLITMSSPSTGRVEVKHEGRWGSICGHSFDNKAARVLCRMLGFESDGAQFYVNGTFGKSDEQPWLDNLKCDGFEQDISMCQKNWTTKACNGIDNVGIACAPTPVRLVSGAGPWEGRVEVFMHGQWGTICDSSFNVEEASVICRMVGFKEAFTQPRMMLSSYFGQSNLPIRMSAVSCSGTELDINACILGTWGNNTCSRKHEVGVDCRETNVRLSGGSHDMEGRVEILRKGIWSAICDEDWDDVEATIVCKTLASFPFDRQVIGKSFKGSFFGAGRGLISYSRVKCNGSEIDLMHCSFKEIISPTCDHSNEAGVACAFKEQIKLTPPSNTPEGTVLVNVDNKWNTICDKDFGQEEAQVFCRELGYWSSTSKPYTNAWFGSGNGTSQDVRPQCTGSETKITFCPMEESWNVRSCPHSNDAGIQCTPTPLGASNIRLVNGRYPGMGRLEVQYNNNWGSFCFRHWHEHDTDIVCRMLKYGHTKGTSYSAPRNGSSVLIGALQCTGHENDIGNCKADLDKSTCTTKVVGVDCTGNINVRLGDGQHPLEGRVDIYDGRRWGSLCDHTITVDAAKVICSTATGYRDTQPVFTHMRGLEFHQGEFAVNKIACDGWEEHIAQCTFSKTGSCSLHFTHIKCFRDCVKFHFQRSGVITSAGYGTDSYEPNIDCIHVIKPPKTIYKIEIVDLQMADSGDYIQINDAPNGQVLGHFTVFDGYPILLFSEQFYIRFKTNGAKESKGFNITWSVATIKDTLSVNCENQQWGAAVNLTSLKYLHKDAIRPDKMIISYQNCTGMIYDDLVLFQQHYDDCGSSKTINDTYDFVIYSNEIVYLDHGIRKWTAPLECKKQRTTRIAHYHMYPNKRFVLRDEKNQGFNFSVNLFYDWVSRISDKNPYDFKQFYFYEITLLDKDRDLSFTVERCSSNHHKNGKRLFRNIIDNARAVSNDISLTKLSRERTLVGLSMKEDLATEFSCDVKIVLL